MMKVRIKKYTAWVTMVVMILIISTKAYTNEVFYKKESTHTNNEEKMSTSANRTYTDIKKVKKTEDYPVVLRVHIPQELRIRSGGTERHSASN